MKKAIVQKVWDRIQEWSTQIRMTRGIRQAVAKAKFHPEFTAETAVEYLFSSNAKDIAPWQYPEELVQLAKEIEIRRPRTVVEIGTASGGTLFLACCLATDDALLVSLDLPDGEFGGGFPNWKGPLYKEFARGHQTVEIIRGNSHSQEVEAQLQNVIGNRKIDYLFLDGDHTYDGVKKDFETYSKFLDEDAIVAFHDIVSDKTVPPNHFVSVYWNEIKQKYSHKEFIRDLRQSKLGLGVLFIQKPRTT